MIRIRRRVVIKGDMSAPVRMYFSFRSPYSWLSVERLARENVALDMLPLVRLPEGARFADPGQNPLKAAYVGRDVGRLARAAGLSVAWPQPFDTDWPGPHNAFQFAKERGKGMAFAHAAYRARFTKGADLGQEAVIAEVATRSGVDAAGAVAAMSDTDIEERKIESALAHLEDDKPFGVPFFVYRDEPFWGQDRIDLLLRAVAVSQPAA